MHSGHAQPGWGPNESRLDEGALRRLRTLARIAAVWALLVVLRLIHLQIWSHDEYRQLAQSQQERVIELHAPRGQIYDRNGETLAMSSAMKSICVNPMLVRNRAITAELLGRVLALDPAELEQRMESAVTNGRGFLWVKRRVTSDEFQRTMALRLSGVESREETERFYPKEQLAAHLLGGVDHEEKGNAGIELGLEEDLEGIPGVMRILKDVKDHGYESVIESKPQPGKSVWLSIDERIQFVAERELEKAVKGCRCKTGSIVAMNPRTGDILAMASYPTYSLNEPVKPGEDLSNRLNLAIAAPFEPGSVFKVITLAAALEKTRLGPDSPINCLGGTISLHGRVIHEAKNGFGVIPMRMVLAKSSNVGAIQVALATGGTNLHEYVQRFGFGKRTGVPLPAEEPGTVHDVKDWGATSIGSVAMGHELTTTTLQLAQACATVANGGKRMRPRLVLQRQRPGEPLEVEPLGEGEPVIEPRNAARLRRMMQDVVIEGTGKTAQIIGYDIGGKTGSAQIYDHDIKQYTHKYNASFMGMAPLEDPKVVVVVTLNGSSLYGGVVATPVFREVTAAALRILDVPRDYEVPVQVAQAQLPKADPEAANDATSAGAAPVAVTPEVAAHLEIAALNHAPNLVGKTKRDVLSETAAAGLVVEARGAGIAREQRPAPGTVLMPGERIVVEFRR